ncbi:hypothetical protein Poli38472_000266 [Pythium oligandrum]|uniref:BZIP domain-containing protein n=1 Tax=Pythium oligandrum TaxID=41045 RepID=A0A8K1FGP4_PYTOL|nr:hypothetical protein Poli38472_000266 [Pythium oligandrum]|eukprot:TMW60224.1 hypothetical protein Poli38472_000266 [Pythium oligandrum]
MQVSTPQKLVLPSIGPLFNRSLLVEHQDTQDFHHANLRTPTGVHALASFDAAFATSSPVKKEYKKPGASKDLGTFKLDALIGSTSPTDVTDSSGSLADEEEKLRLSRERNRLHAQRTRIRKRELLESLKDRISSLQSEFAVLKQAYESHVTAMYLLSLGDLEAHLSIRGMEDISDVTDVMQDVAQVICVNDEDVDAAAAASGQTSLILHDRSCAFYHMDPDEEGSGMEDVPCACLERGSEGKRTHLSAATTASLLTCSKEEREQIRRERNRLHARRARLRKKLMLEKSQQAVQSMRSRNEALRARLAVLVTTIYDDDEDIFEEDNSGEDDSIVEEEQFVDNGEGTDEEGERIPVRPHEQAPAKAQRSFRDFQSPRVALQRTTEGEKQDLVTHPQDTLQKRREEHFQACFVRLDPPLLRGLAHLDLSSQKLKLNDLKVLSSNLFLFQSLTSISLADNQLDDTCNKHLRSIMCLDGLKKLDLSCNLLGRGAAKTIADRLKQRLSLESLDIHGNPWFFSFDDALDVAYHLAQGIAVSSLLQVRLSAGKAQPHLMRERCILSSPPSSPSRQARQSKSQRGFEQSDQGANPAEALTRELVELYQGGAIKYPKLLSFGLVHAELSRRCIVNLMKLAPKLQALDLTYAFIGSASVRIIATALRMPSYSSLTQLNLRGNRLRSAGAISILFALRVNSVLTDLDLSGNDILPDVLPEVAQTLMANHAIVRLDLARNHIFSDTSSEIDTTRKFINSIRQHPALLSLGDLSCIDARPDIQDSISVALKENREAQNDLVLLAVKQTLNFEQHLTNPKTGAKTSTTKVTAVTLSSSEHMGAINGKRVWLQSKPIEKQSRVSITWKSKHFIVGKDGMTSPCDRVAWKIRVLRRCEVTGIVEEDAAVGVLSPSSPDDPYTLCSALVYCDESDKLELHMFIADDQDEYNFQSTRQRAFSVKILIKDVVIVLHSITSRHLCFAYDLTDPQETPAQAEWTRKPVRIPSRDPFPYTTSLQRLYISRTHNYRLVWRVKFPFRVSRLSNEQKEDFYSQFYWHIIRSPCWNPELSENIVEGSTNEMQAAIRSDNEAVFVTSVIELVAGEYLELQVFATKSDTPLLLTQLFLLYETSAWDSPSGPRLPTF